jgi:MSHA biogenesis protein MshJ
MMLWLRDLMDRFDQLSLRERVLVLGALVGVLLLVWDSALMGPLERDRKGRLQQVEMLRAEVSGLERSTEAIVAQGASDPDRETREAVQQMKKEIAELDTRLAGATSGLIAPNEMLRVLEQMLVRASSKLTLRALRTLPPEAVVAPAAAGATGATPGRPSAQVYRHGVELELSGTYLDTLNFLQALEALPWRFFWDRIEFAVEQHPQGRVRLLIFTLGLEEGWIGV